MTILVSNLSRFTTAVHLSNLFLPFGIVQSVKIVMDKAGHSLGSGYVKMDSIPGLVAISELNTLKFMNYYIEVREASV